MTPITIDLAPSGMLRLSFAPDHWADIPATEAGLQYLVQMLQARHSGLTKVAQGGAPTQAQINEFFAKQAAKTEKHLGIDPVNLEELGL